jgi:hypothetical protein
VPCVRVVWVLLLLHTVLLHTTTLALAPAVSHCGSHVATLLLLPPPLSLWLPSVRTRGCGRLLMPREPRLCSTTAPESACVRVCASGCRSL